MKLTAEKQQYLVEVFGAERAAAIVQHLESQEKGRSVAKNPALRNFSTPTGTKATAGQLEAFLRNIFDSGEVDSIIAAIDAGYADGLGELYWLRPDDAGSAVTLLFRKEWADLQQKRAELKAVQQELIDQEKQRKQRQQPRFNPFPGVNRGQKQRRRVGPFNPFPGVKASHEPAHIHISRDSLRAGFGAKAADIIRRLERAGHTTTGGFNPFPGVRKHDD